MSDLRLVDGDAEAIAVLRSLLGEVNGKIAELEAERDTLAVMRDAYTTYLAVLEHGRWPLPHQQRNSGGGRRLGTVGLQLAIRRVLEAAPGTSMHATEILRRVLQLGARTNARDPVGVVALLVDGLVRDGHPVIRTAPRTWAWVRAEEGA